METIWINVDDEPRRVNRQSFLSASLKGLRDFGYPTLTLEEVDKAVRALQESDGCKGVIQTMLRNDVMYPQPDESH